MDADDYSSPDRLEAQVHAIKADDRLGCVGTFAWFFRDDPEKRDGLLRRPIDHEEIQETLLWSSPMVHATMMARTQILKDIGGYDERYRYSADLELYDRLFPRCRAANVPLPLFGLRRHPGQDSHSQKALRESIQILLQRQSSGRYQGRELDTIRAAQYLHEALSARMDRRYLGVARNVAGAFWFAPAITLRHFLPGWAA
jgi:hypothetical protein